MLQNIQHRQVQFVGGLIFVGFILNILRRNIFKCGGFKLKYLRLNNFLMVFVLIFKAQETYPWVNQLNLVGLIQVFCGHQDRVVGFHEEIAQLSLLSLHNLSFDDNLDNVTLGHVYLNLKAEDHKETTN